MTLLEWRGHMPQTKVARLLGVSRRTWQRWERGHQPPPLILLHLIQHTQPGQLQEIEP